MRWVAVIWNNQESSVQLSEESTNPFTLDYQKLTKRSKHRAGF